MSAETENRLGSIQALVGSIREAAHFEKRKARLTELEERMNGEGFWDDPEAAKPTIIELKRTKEVVKAIEELEAEYDDLRMLYELAKEEGDEGSLTEVETDTHRVLQTAERLEVRTLLSGKFDEGSCFLSIQPGAGGTESCDWAAMLKRMYQRWAERNGYKISTIHEIEGDEAGIKSVTISIQGAFAYGYLRAEMGVHRLVRISPYDAKSRRHTSFASVDVSPEVADVSVDIEESDLRVDTYRASGAGGQHVNTTDSAVRITHIPTGIVVQCQNERSQHSNRATAMVVLQSRLLQFEEQKRQKEMEDIAGEKGEIAFGSQIRSYVLHPYKMVKDHRTSEETGNVDHVLDGDLNDLIEAYLRQFARKTTE